MLVLTPKDVQNITFAIMTRVKWIDSTVFKNTHTLPHSVKLYAKEVLEYKELLVGLGFAVDQTLDIASGIAHTFLKAEELATAPDTDQQEFIKEIALTSE